MRRHHFSVGAGLLAVVVAVMATRAADDKPRVTTLPLSDVKPMPLIRLSSPKPARDWPMLRHAPIDSAGFNVLMLPMHYADPLDIGDSAEASAFSFLLSSDLDFSPGSYNARHAYFVFKRSRKEMEPMRDDYDPVIVSQMIRDWRATHAVGGTITKNEKGYTGELQIFAPDGTVQTDKKFDQPRDYFELLGDMSVAVMTELDTPPNPALVKHLHEHRASSDSVLLLGKAAFAKERSPEEFALYDQILKQDPDFGQVRYWAANQKGWQGMAADAQAEEFFQSLKSFPTIEAARTLDTSLLPDEQAAQVPGLIKTVHELVGPDSPAVEEITLSTRTTDHPHPTADDLTAAQRIVAKYPNALALEDPLLRNLFDGQIVPMDPAYCASLALVMLDNHFQTGNGGGRVLPAELFAGLSNMAGLSDDSVAALLTQIDDYPGLAPQLLDALMLTGNYGTVCNAYMKFEPQLTQSSGQSEALAACCAGMAGRIDVLQHLLADRGEQLEKFRMKPLAQAYLAILQNQPVDTAAVDKVATTARDYIPHTFYLVLRSQLDLMAGKSDRFEDVLGETTWQPGSRRLWFLLDAYDQQSHRPELDDMYRALEFCYPGDEQVKVLVTGWKKRNAAGADPAVDVKKVDKLVANYPNRPWKKADGYALEIEYDVVPKGLNWTVAAAAAAEVSAGHPAHARELVQRLMFLAGRTRRRELHSWADHLYYQIDAPEPVPTTAPLK